MYHLLKKSGRKKMINRIKQFFISLRKFGDDVVDLFQPKNVVVIRLIETGTGKTLRTIKGRNVVTGWIDSNNSHYISGKDLMRRLLIDPAVNTSLQGDSSNGRWVDAMEFGVGSVAELSSDGKTFVDRGSGVSANGLDSALNPQGDALKEIDPNSGYSVSATACEVSFTCKWESGHINGNTLSEVVLLSNNSPHRDVVARKTFTPFEKTSEFEIELTWTLRF
tara:strand:+ start:1822 stop:2487 length:666 start_codon:yes stop_codon:yes gene_type:complete